MHMAALLSQFGMMVAAFAFYWSVTTACRGASERHHIDEVRPEQRPRPALCDVHS